MQEFYDDKSKRLQRCFKNTYEKWKALIGPKGHSNQAPSSIKLQGFKTRIRSASTDVNQVYEDLQHHSPPGGETQRRIEARDPVRKQILKHIWNLLDDKTMSQGSQIEQITSLEMSSSVAFKKSSLSSQN